MDGPFFPSIFFHPHWHFQAPNVLSFNTGAVFGWIRTPESRRRKHLSPLRKPKRRRCRSRVFGSNFFKDRFFDPKKGICGGFLLGGQLFDEFCALIVNGILWMALGIAFFKALSGCVWGSLLFLPFLFCLSLSGVFFERFRCFFSFRDMQCTPSLKLTTNALI